jgi:hypothetical protein
MPNLTHCQPNLSLKTPLLLKMEAKMPFSIFRPKLGVGGGVKWARAPAEEPQLKGAVPGVSDSRRKNQKRAHLSTVSSSLRVGMAFSPANSAPATPKRRRVSPVGDTSSDWSVHWGWSPAESPDPSNMRDDSSCFQSPMGRGSSSAENKRGRPRADMITGLIEEGAVSPSAIKCKFCSRVFPREKSLQAHLRTHTGESKFFCTIFFIDFDGVFCSSFYGILKMRLRTWA